MSQSTSPSVDSSDQASNFSEVLRVYFFMGPLLGREPSVSESSEAWQDEMCLEPLLAPEPGFSRLCNACRRVFYIHLRKKSAKHIQNLDTLLQSTHRGCTLCALILYRIERNDLSHRPSPQLNLRYEVSVSGYPGVVTFGDNSTLVLTVKLLPSGNFSYFFLCEFGLTFVHLGTHSQYLNSDHHVVPSTSSLENQFLARKWLHKCLSGHENCTAGARSLPNVPTRLIEIDGSDAQPLLRLVEKASHPRKEKYMTLSHCWGTADFLTLRESCLNDMRKDIVWSALPKTFQDAVTVTMWFKIKYLWIDSLCIIQDSYQDWERESKFMKHVYKNSLLTIAATSAVDATGGLFVHRNPDVVRSCRVRARWSRGGRELAGDYLYLDTDLWRREILESPLMKRAWVCQERLLSPRMLHFGRSQMFWECQDRGACETFPENLSFGIHRSPSRESKRLLVFKGGDFLINHWNPVIERYSTCNLTKMSDKCVAFAGIVEVFQDFAQSTYFAGLWRHNLEQQLLWAVEHVRPAGRTQSYIAPSWSWLSINGNYITTRWFSGDEKVVLEILDICVTHSSDSILGPIKSGYIRARGVLGPVVWERKDVNHGDFHRIDGRFRELGECHVLLDEIVQEISGDAVYLPIIETTIIILVIYGLWLVPTGEAKEEYRRIGWFRALDGDGWRRLPKTTFTLV